MNDLLKELTESVGISGDEGEVRQIIRRLIKDHVDETRVDTMGNLIALKRGSEETDTTVLIDAHMDEVGLMITGYDRDGSCKFEPVGGVDDRLVLGKVVRVGSKKVTGIVGARPIHLVKWNQRKKVIGRDSMRIDIGAKSKEQVKRKIGLGDSVSFNTKYEEMGNIAIGKAFDDRTGCAALIELLRGERHPFTIVGAFTVQEEVGIRGAGVVAFSVKPDLALVLECTPAYDLPNERDVSPNVALGKGPSIYVMDSRTIQDPGFVAHIVKTAENSSIPFQIRQPGGGGTNTGAIQRRAGPIPVATIATPARYIHAPVSMINLDDYTNVIKLAEQSLRTLDIEAIRRNIRH